MTRNGYASLKGAVIGAISGAAFQGIGKAFKGMAAQNAANSVKGLSEFGGNMLTSGQIAGQVASHAMAGGVISTLGGGKFGHGFFSAGFTKAAGGAFLPGGGNLTTGEILGGTIASAVIGGTSSVLSGGKFANGARTAIYQYLFNQVNKEIQTSDTVKLIRGARKLFDKYMEATNGDVNFIDSIGDMSKEEIKLLTALALNSDGDAKSHMTGYGLHVDKSDIYLSHAKNELITYYRKIHYMETFSAVGQFMSGATGLTGDALTNYGAKSILKAVGVNDFILKNM